MKREVVPRIEGATRNPRNEVIARVSEAIQQAQGSVMDSRFFSNTALFLSVELKTSRILELRAGMINAGVNLSVTTQSLDQYLRASAASEDVIRTCHIFITFFHDEPDLRIPVPAVPG